MGCTHPLGLERIDRVENGRRVKGGRCPMCGSIAYQGESLWTVIKRNWFGIEKRNS